MPRTFNCTISQLQAAEILGSDQVVGDYHISEDQVVSIFNQVLEMALNEEIPSLNIPRIKTWFNFYKSIDLSLSLSSYIERGLVKWILVGLGIDLLQTDVGRSLKEKIVKNLKGIISGQGYKIWSVRNRAYRAGVDLSNSLSQNSYFDILDQLEFLTENELVEFVLEESLKISEETLENILKFSTNGLADLDPKLRPMLLSILVNKKFQARDFLSVEDGIINAFEEIEVSRLNEDMHAIPVAVNEGSVINVLGPSPPLAEMVGGSMEEIIVWLQHQDTHNEQ